MGAHVGETLAQAPLCPSGEWAGDELPRAQCEQRADDHQIRRGVDEEAHLHADRRDERSCDGRPDQARDRVDRAVRRDSARQQLGPDELEQDRLHDRALDGQYEAEHRRERVDPPDRDVARRHHDTERRGQHAGHGGGGEEQPAVVDPVSEHACGCPEQQHREELQRGRDAEPVAAVGDLEHQPDDGERL
jgi:hypothetical protein